MSVHRLRDQVVAKLITYRQRRSPLELCSSTSVIHYLRNTLRRLRHPVPG